MISLPAARIFASNATLTGSIGVILETGNAAGLLDKLGLSAEAIISGPLKDQPSFTHALSPAGRDYLQALVGDMFGQFVTMVAQARHLDEARVRELADGRAYTGRQALGLGLVDEIGGEPEARAWLAKEKGVGNGTADPGPEARHLVRPHGRGHDGAGRTPARAGPTGGAADGDLGAGAGGVEGLLVLS